MVFIQTQGNIANITDLPRGIPISITAKANSSQTQVITITSKDKTVDLLFQGSGERNTIIGKTSITVNSDITVKFEYLSNGNLSNSTLNNGGPYAIGSFNILVIVAENGDDVDFNDGIVELNWRAPT